MRGLHNRSHYASSLPTPRLLKCSDCSRERTHSAKSTSSSPLELSSIMSAIGGFDARSAEGAEASKRPGPGSLHGGSKKAGMATVAAYPSVPRPRGRPPGSRNKKTMAATVAAGPTAAAAMVGTLWLPPVHQPLAYTSVAGYVSFLVPVLAGSGDRLRLPSSSWRRWSIRSWHAPSCKSAAAASHRTASRSTTTAKGSATSVAGGRSSSRTTA
jgi:hypothetical protein